MISALALILTSAATILLTKQKERAAEWRAKKLAYYEEFFAAASGIVGQAAPPAAKVRFATAVNNLHLLASIGVISRLLKKACERRVSAQVFYARSWQDPAVIFAMSYDSPLLTLFQQPVRALHAFTDEIAESNETSRSKEQHDTLWFRLVWEIRADLNDPPTKEPDSFSARLWASGAGGKTAKLSAV